MTAVLKRALCANSDKLSDKNEIYRLHERERYSGQKRHYFLGGLLHINGIEIDGSLGVLLRDLFDGNEDLISSYIVTINEETNGDFDSVGRTADQMHNLKNVPLTNEGIAARKLIMGDDLLLDYWASMDVDTQRTEMENHFSQIILTGYSYGTSLIQQMERNLVAELRSRGLPLEPLLKVNAVNIGPVDIPSFDDGLQAEFNVVSGTNYTDRHGFTQTFALKSIDKIMDSVIGRRLVPEQTSDELLSTYGTERLKFYVDHSSDAHIKRVGKSKFAEGREVARLNMDYDCEGHDLRLYLNRKTVIKSSNGAYVTYPSSFLVDFIRQTHVSALCDVDVSANGMGMFGPTLSVENYLKLNDEFDLIVKNYARLGFNEAIEWANDVINKVDAAEQHLIFAPKLKR